MTRRHTMKKLLGLAILAPAFAAFVLAGPAQASFGCGATLLVDTVVKGTHATFTVSSCVITVKEATLVFDGATINADGSLTITGTDVSGTAGNAANVEMKDSTITVEKFFRITTHDGDQDINNNRIIVNGTGTELGARFESLDLFKGDLDVNNNNFTVVGPLRVLSHDGDVDFNNNKGTAGPPRTYASTGDGFAEINSNVTGLACTTC